MLTEAAPKPLAALRGCAGVLACRRNTHQKRQRRYGRKHPGRRKRKPRGCENLRTNCVSRNSGDDRLSAGMQRNLFPHHVPIISRHFGLIVQMGRPSGCRSIQSHPYPACVPPRPTDAVLENMSFHCASPIFSTGCPINRAAFSRIADGLIHTIPASPRVISSGACKTASANSQKGIRSAPLV